MKKAFPVLIIIAVVLALTGRYLLYGVPHEFLTGEYKGTFEGDYDFTLELVSAFARWWIVPLWSETYSGPIAVFASNFHVFEQALLYPFTHDLALSIKILQALQFLIAGLGMYALSLHIFKDRVGAVFSATLYMFTPFYIGHLLSYLHYTGVYLLAPLVYLYTMKTISERSYGSASVLCIVMTYSLLAHPQNIFIGGIFYALFFLFCLVHEVIKSKSGGELFAFIKRIVPVTVFIIAVTFLLAAFITLPTLRDNYPYLRTSWVKGAAELVKVDTGHIGSHSQTVLASISMQHWPWQQTPLKGGEYPPWGYMAIYLIPFAFTVFSLLIHFNWLTFVFMLMTALSLETALGVNAKIDLFTFASRHIPFFGMSRTPYAYVNSALLVFCLLPSATFIWLSTRLSDAFKNPDGKVIGDGPRWFLFSVIAIPYLFAAGWYGNSYNWTLISSKTPGYLPAVWSWMDLHNKDKGRVIETCGIPTAMLLGDRMLPNSVDMLERYNRKDYLDRYLALFGFKYVITPSLHSQRDKTFDRKGYMVPSVFDPSESMEEYYSALTTEYYFMYERLKKDPSFKYYGAGTKDVAIFENTEYFPDYEMYPARAVLTLGGTDSYDILGLKRFSAGKTDPVKVAPVFVAQSKNLKRLREIKGAATDLVFHNTDALDLYLTLERDKLLLFRPRAADPKNWELSIFSFGIQQPFPQLDHSIGNSLFGEMTFSDYAITTKHKGSSLRDKIDIKRAGLYRVMLRGYDGKDAPRISYSIDGSERGTVDQTRESGYRWMTLWEGELQAGRHTLEITVDEDKPAYIDSVAVLDPRTIDGGIRASMETFKDMPQTYIVNHNKLTVTADTASAILNIGAQGVYSPALRLGRFDEIKGGGRVTLLVDGNPAGELDYNGLTTEVKEFTLPDIRLSAGPHTVALKGLKTGLYISMLSLSTAPAALPSAPVRFSYSRTGPSSYDLDITAGKPQLVVFNETNYPGWEMISGGSKKTPVVTNMFMNGFIVGPDAPGPAAASHAHVRYSNTAQLLGVRLSLAALASISVVALVSWRRKSRKQR